MNQSVMQKLSPETICLGVGLIVCGLLTSLCIDNNKIISGIPYYIPSPSNLRCVVKKSCEATFMRIAGFFCNYPRSISCNKGEHAGIVRLVKEIAFWDSERVQSMRLDADPSKGSSEEVAKALGVSLNQIDTYRSDGGRILLLGRTTYYGGGRVTERLSIELKTFGCISFFYSIFNCCMKYQYKARNKSVERKQYPNRKQHGDGSRSLD